MLIKCQNVSYKTHDISIKSVHKYSNAFENQCSPCHSSFSHSPFFRLQFDENFLQSINSKQKLNYAARKMLPANFHQRGSQRVSAATVLLVVPEDDDVGSHYSIWLNTCI